MELSIETLLFALFAVGCVVSAIGVVAIRNPVKGAMSLIACFFSLSCLFLLQAAEMIAVLEVLVYAGAIMVLFVFVIMLVENKDAPMVRNTLGQKIAMPIKIIGVLMVAYVMYDAISASDLTSSKELPSGFGSVKSVGHEFFDNFLFHFEMTSILLLVGIIGAVIISKRSKGES